MKYIRTPIGIYDLENSVFYDFDGLCKYHISHCEYYENNPEDCKTSDTIEELCDEFVLIEHYSDREDIHHHYRDKKSFIEDYIGYEHIDIVLRCYTIYGAIWTDKGLIYVAKMNDKGELVLI